MPSHHDHMPPPCHPHASTRHGRCGRWIIAFAVLTASLGVTACGSSAPKTVTILNTQKIQTAIQQSALAQRRERADVSCPSGVHQQKGLIFSCTAVVGHTATQFVVTEVDASGDVRYVAR